MSTVPHNIRQAGLTAVKPGIGISVEISYFSVHGSCFHSLLARLEEKPQRSTDYLYYIADIVYWPEMKLVKPGCKCNQHLKKFDWIDLFIFSPPNPLRNP